MISIVCLTASGYELALKISSFLKQSDEPHQILFKPEPFKQVVQDCFKKHHRMLMICATGIVMRTLAPVIKSKYEDSPVVVMDEFGKFAIPLLSGHEGGANEWASQLSEFLGSQLVLTTANGYLNPIYTIGLGCERHCPIDYLEELLNTCIAQAGISTQMIHSFNSIDIKHDEGSLIEIANHHNKPFYVYDVPALRKMEPFIKTPSDYVFKTVGVYGVAESAALAAASKYAGNSLELVVTKQKNAKATCAIARAYPKSNFSPQVES